MNIILQLWNPQKKIGKILSAILAMLRILTCLALMIIPFFKFEGKIFEVLKWAFIACFVLGVDTFLDYSKAIEKKCLQFGATIISLLFCVYLHNYWELLTVLQVIIIPAIIGVIELMICIKCYKTIRFFANQKSKDLSLEQLDMMFLGGTYCLAILSFILAHSISKIMVFVFGIIAILLLSASILKVLSNGVKVKKSIFGAMTGDIFSVLALIVYLIYLIPEDYQILQTSIISIVAAIIGGALTFAGVSWTINDNSEKLKLERKLSVKPYLVTYNDYCNDVMQIPNKDITFVEINGCFTIQSHLPDGLKRILSLSSCENEIKNPIDSAVCQLAKDTYLHNNYLLYYEISNCGAGNAIDVKLNINSMCLPSFCVTTMQPKKYMLIFNRELLEQTDDKSLKIKMIFEYTDVASLGRYRQVESFLFETDSEDNLMLVQYEDDLLTSPDELIDSANSKNII